MKPGSQPVRALAEALDGDVDDLEWVVDDLLASEGAQRLLFVVDQFEEVFTQASRDELQRFVAAIQRMRMLQTCVLLVTMRADYFGHLMDSPLWPIPDEQMLKVAPPRGQALLDIVERPARLAGVRLESGLIHRLLADTANEPGVLPLIQSTMVLLWRSIRDNCMTLGAYERLGSDGRVGLLVAMAKIADATLHNLTMDQQATARRIFLRLVQFGQGRPDVRRPQFADELRAEGDDQQQFEIVLNHLIHARLLTAGGEGASANRRIDISHEALISNWPTLQAWISQFQKEELYRRQLVARANLWVQSGRRTGLLHESELEEVETWLVGAEATLLGGDGLVREWIAASRRAIAEAENRAERRRLQAIRQISEQLNKAADLDKALTQSLQVVAHMLGASRGSIMLRGTGDEEVICRAVLMGDGSAIPANIPIRFAQGPGLAAWVMRQSEFVVLADVLDDQRWVQEDGRAADVRSVVATPLVLQDEPLGVLMLTSPQPDFFASVASDLLAMIASQIAMSIQNWNLSSSIVERADQLAENVKLQREQASQANAIVQSIGDGLIVLDQDWRVTLFNPVAEQILGIPQARVLHQPVQAIGDLGATPDEQYLSSIIGDALVAGLRELQGVGQVNRILELKYPQTLALNFVPVKSPVGDTSGSIITIRDITRELESDRARREFISSVSHELRTPLVAIKGYIDLLLMGAAGSLDEKQLPFVEVVKNNANRLMGLINDILEIGRIDADKVRLSFEQVSIEDIFRDVLQVLQAEIDRKSLTVQIDVEAELPQITADLRRLNQVVLNTVSNAVKYTYAQGRVTLRAFVNQAGLLQVEIEDNGVGMSSDQQQYLFRRFYRADNPLRDEAGGTGLGLSIAKSFVELHGGEMWVQSEAGVGSTFSFIFPVTQPEQAQGEG